MAEFILKDRYGKDRTFDKETIFVKGADGELMQFTHGTGNPVIESLEITENGTYNAPEGVDGYNPVVVNVAGGSSADVRYVTFMSYDGLVEYGKKAVAVGDDCADPIARGIFATPTRESDVQYNYTFYGWATEPNGGADANWNKAVTEDKTVYANFSKAVRYYTITYYDDDGTTVLKTESLAYGSMPNYKPEKDGYAFGGWKPEFSIVNSDRSYTAQWAESIDFADASWTTIAEKSADGTASQVWKVGDTKTVTLTNADGSKEYITVAIAGFNHDDLSDGTGKAGISIVCMTLPSYKCIWRSSISYNRLYDGSSVENALSDIILPSLPNDLQEVIKKVKKECDGGYTTGSEVVTGDYNLWLLSMYEIGCDSDTSVQGGNTLNRLGTKYDLFPSVSELSTAVFNLPTAKNEVGTAVKYYTRQLALNTSTARVCRVSDKGAFGMAESGTSTTNSYNKAELNIRFGFCV